MDPLSLGSGILAVVGAALASSKALYNFTKFLKDAPSTLTELGGEVASLHAILSELKTQLDNPNNSVLLQDDGLQKAILPIEGCHVTCQALEKELQGIMSHSGDKASKRGSITFWFKNSTIGSFLVKLERWKISLNLTLQLVIL